jgi:hypothetical protein
MRGAVKKKGKEAVLEEKLDERSDKGERLFEEHREFIGPAADTYKEFKGSDMPDHMIANMAICMENLCEEYDRQRHKRSSMGLNEDTYTSAIDNLQRHGFKIIAALMPTLVSEEIVSVQAMDRRKGEIYFLDFDYGDTKAGVTSGDTMIGATTGQANTTYDYSSDWDYYTPTGWTGDGATNEYTATSLRRLTVVTNTVTITATATDNSTMTVTDDGSGNLVGDVGSGTKSINYTTGAISVSFESFVKNASSITVKWRYDWEGLGETGVPSVNIDILSQDVQAYDRMLRARWLIGAAYDLEKVHGRSAQSDLLTALVSEIRHEIDNEIMQLLLTTAASGGATTISFDTTSPYTQVGKWEYYKELIFTLETASEAIFQETKRGIGNFIVCGKNLMQLLVGLDDFESAIGPNTQPPSGPHRRGVFRGRWVIYSNPFYAANKFLLGWKGEGWMNAGAVYAPYMPAFTTPVTALDDMRYRVGVQTAYGKSVLNPKFYVEGTMLST